VVTSVIDGPPEKSPEYAAQKSGSLGESSQRRPHSTGVESAIQTLSNQKSLSMARSRITCLISGSAARGRLL
jgi:hypothetical protein